MTVAHGSEAQRVSSTDQVRLFKDGRWSDCPVPGCRAGAEGCVVLLTAPITLSLHTIPTHTHLHHLDVRPQPLQHLGQEAGALEAVVAVARGHRHLQGEAHEAKEGA